MSNLYHCSEFKKEFIDEYCSGVFSDELDKLGYRDQVVNGWQINNSNFRMFGKLRVLTIEEIATSDERIEVGLGFLGAMSHGEVLLVKGSYEFAYFGELMTRLSVEVGINGTIIDGLTRDSFYTKRAELPIFAKGYTPKDIKGRGRVKECDTEVIVGGVTVRPGDYVFGDNDALVFIPQFVFDELMPKVENAVREEAEIKRKINEGYSIKKILLDHSAF